MKLIRLAHVNVRVADLASAVPFYRDLLGLEQIFRKDPTGKGAWFRLGAGSAFTEASAGPPKPQGGEGGEVHLTEDDSPQPVSGRHFACDVEGLAGLKQRLQAAGRPIEHDEGWRFFTRDPDGNRIELVDASRRPS